MLFSSLVRHRPAQSDHTGVQARMCGGKDGSRGASHEGGGGRGVAAEEELQLRMHHNGRGGAAVGDGA